MLVKIFVQENCPNCPQSKELGKQLLNDGVSVEFHDVRTTEGLAESLMFDVLSTPSTVILKENKVVQSFLGATPKIEEVKKWL
ncbi:MAG: thioredoxin family protein [Nanoarchaeota archaeon]|nr:thioredoxin family protein [Nanoarchaeota archaeon]